MSPARQGSSKRKLGPKQHWAGRSRRYWKNHPIERNRIEEGWSFDLRARAVLRRAARAKP